MSLRTVARNLCGAGALNFCTLLTAAVIGATASAVLVLFLISH